MQMNEYMAAKANPLKTFSRAPKQS